jgi:oligosaccharide repeat unit polymerase
MITTALIIDLIVLTLCGTALWRFGRLSHSHPGTIYFVFHILAFTWRLASIAGGSPTLFNGPFWGWGLRYEPVSPDEIVRATYMADTTLIVMTAAFLIASAQHPRKLRRRVPKTEQAAPTLVLNHIWEAVVFAFPIGLIGLYFIARLPSVERAAASAGSWGASSWTTNTQTWAGISLLALIYWYGFRWWLVLPMSLYLLVMSYQGFHRFRIVIPLIIMIQLYLDRRNRKWPTLRLTAAIVTVGLLFFTLKTVGEMAQAGARPSEIVEASTDILERTLEGDSEMQYLDSFASTVTLVDRHDEFYYGRTYLTALVLPIPRPLWPDKPRQNAYQHDISTPVRPMAENGMIATFLGETYANFGYVGIVLVPFIIAYILTRFYLYAYTRHYYSVARFIYLLISAVLIQVFRDGLISLIIHTGAAMMPLFFIVALHHLLPDRAARYRRQFILHSRGVRTTDESFGRS